MTTNILRIYCVKLRIAYEFLSNFGLFAFQFIKLHKVADSHATSKVKIKLNLEFCLILP